MCTPHGGFNVATGNAITASAMSNRDPKDPPQIQKYQDTPRLHKFENPRVRNFSARNSGAGNGCANFMGAWFFWLFLLENPHAHQIPRLRGWCWGFLEGGGGGSANFIFMSAGTLLNKRMRDVRANVCLLPCEMSQEPGGSCSIKLVQMIFFVLGGFGEMVFLLLKLRV